MKLLMIQPNKVAKVDDKDYPRLMQYTWTINKGVVRNNRGTKLGNFIMKPEKGYIVVHDNGDRMDFRRENLSFKLYEDKMND